MHGDGVVKPREVARLDRVEVKRAGIVSDFLQGRLVELGAETDGIDRHIHLTRNCEDIGEPVLAQRFSGAVVIHSIAKKNDCFAPGYPSQGLDRRMEGIPERGVAACHRLVDGRLGRAPIDAKRIDGLHLAGETNDLHPVLRC